MPILAASLKVFALAVALSCLGATSPAPDSLPRLTAGDPASAKLQCRIYFGCAPTARTNTALARQQEFVR
jgi:hypothetical protein